MQLVQGSLGQIYPLKYNQQTYNLFKTIHIVEANIINNTGLVLCNESNSTKYIALMLIRYSARHWNAKSHDIGLRNAALLLSSDLLHSRYKRREFLISRKQKLLTRLLFTAMASFSTTDWHAVTLRSHAEVDDIVVSRVIADIERAEEVLFSTPMMIVCYAANINPRESAIALHNIQQSWKNISLIPEIELRL